MDIVTHAMAGTILAGPFLPTAPLTASCFILGSALPDTDALSRLFGKVAFLRWHQTYTHSLPIILLTTMLLWFVGMELGVGETWAAMALGAGMLLHTLMDATNTYGVALLAPFSRRRYCVEWVFFIDGVVVAVSVGFLSIVLVRLYSGQAQYLAVSFAYGCFLAGYWMLRGLLYWRGTRLTPPGTQSLIPSAMIPWQFFGYAVHEGIANLFSLSVIYGNSKDIATCQTFDSKYANLLTGVIEYGLMRRLSSGYCVVEATERDGKTELVCQDLRIRNFGGHFGRLDLTFDTAGKVERKVFHV